VNRVSSRWIEELGVTSTPDRPAQSLRGVLSDDHAFRRWYERVAPRVYAYVFNRCGGSAPLAEELTQQTFVEALRSVDRYDGRADVVAWLCGIARHRLADHYRRLERDNRRHRQLVLRNISESDRPLEGVDRREAIDAAFRAISPEQRAVLLFRYLDGQAVPEIARTIGRSVAATESLLARARRSFARAYGETFDDD
jgi:RNA polymerase sigma-70 factor (ECF subfamily)